MIEFIKKVFDEFIKEEESLKFIDIHSSDKLLGEEVKARTRCAKRLKQIEKRILSKFPTKKPKKNEYL